ncbi:uncharacterized protein MONOS_14705 [Monocercomonoides exilis]|uniref:uncharacterized protein n=1 Tax=Monocercomonoides exilis TaxID=2049356 RepID=UPI00355A33C6|nr:hypothetical protein MONOS_14705 [Monocercomonoides exilis]|eukprot:MONOS_14705.1-p1 / transcript=MONOS_14705.1 / gene=MONOS_14705 / organism=Monocercomonoides_exilis_PA203 / gene_product=unspecified product / transcript_product=unspecified product / location=Mono_scaffold01055:4476-5751(-) / protein_length=398 / sequence_SO=supercontig / SO=protein_coding / is_pseudo=false
MYVDHSFQQWLCGEVQSRILEETKKQIEALVFSDESQTIVKEILSEEIDRRLDEDEERKKAELEIEREQALKKKSAQLAPQLHQSPISTTSPFSSSTSTLSPSFYSTTTSSIASITSSSPSSMNLSFAYPSISSLSSLQPQAMRDASPLAPRLPIAQAPAILPFGTPSQKRFVHPRPVKVLKSDHEREKKEREDELKRKKEKEKEKEKQLKDSKDEGNNEERGKAAEEKAEENDSDGLNDSLSSDKEEDKIIARAKQKENLDNERGQSAFEKKKDGKRDLKKEKEDKKKAEKREETKKRKTEKQKLQSSSPDLLPNSPTARSTDSSSMLNALSSSDGQTIPDKKPKHNLTFLEELQIAQRKYLTTRSRRSNKDDPPFAIPLFGEVEEEKETNKNDDE